jgi:hypothetical protein
MSSLSKPALEALETPGRPFLHNGNPRLPKASGLKGGKSVPRVRIPITTPGLVEPDGIEPTTSCLQSTRSTN